MKVVKVLKEFLEATINSINAIIRQCIKTKLFKK